MRVRKVNSNDVKIHDLDQVKLKTAGNTSVVQFTAGNNKTCSVVNLSKDTYLDKKTGEVKQKKKSGSRYQSPKSVRKSINRLIDLIRCNATDPAKCKWITVTYQDVMADGKQAFLDAKLFLRKLKRHLAKQIDINSGQKSFQYITIAERRMIMKLEIGKKRIYNTNFKNIENVVHWEVLNIKNEQELYLKFVSTNLKYRQGIRLAIDAGDGYIEINNIRSKEFYLWADTAQKCVLVKCISEEGVLSIYNILI